MRDERESGWVGSYFRCPLPPSSSAFSAMAQPSAVPDLNDDNESDHIPDHLWSKLEDPRASSREFLCAYKSCRETCQAGSSSHCVLCPWVAPHKKNASFFYCEEHIALGRCELYDEMNNDDGEGVCEKHMKDYDAVTDQVNEKFGGRSIYEMCDDDDSEECITWRRELVRQIRIWRSRKYGPASAQRTSAQ